MKIIDESKVTDTLSRGNRHSVFRYLDDQSFTLKVLESPQIDTSSLVDLNLEFDILNKLEIDHVPRKVNKVRYRNRPAIIYKYIEGKPLSEHKKGSWKIEEFFPVAIGLCDVLAGIHQQNIVHNDIRPENILVDGSGGVHIIDFGSATRLSSRTVGIQTTNHIRGTIEYMSPEAFGRMNRLVDSRSDIYSLGIVFYQMLLGKVPFTSNDPLELIHWHMAKKAEFKDLPSTLGMIIAKMMAKTPEQRFQSALGLKHDLLQCQELYDRFGKILDFPIATKDYSTTFRIPQKLYGRTVETKILQEKFDYITQGNTHLVLVSGYSGIGKTALVNEIHKPVTERQGYFLSGKFDQYQRDVPYFALIRAFEQFIDQILQEPKAFIDTLSEEIKEAVGINGQVIIDVIPTLELIIGPQPEIKPLPPTESQNRFVNTFLNFIKLFGKEDHPLVILGDDLQWSDQASLELFSNLLLDESARHILIIGAYRSNEVDASHPLMLALDKLKEQTNEVSEIYLEPLREEDVLALVAETLNSGTEEAKSLSELIFKKTNGNPFFVTQFLNRLHQDELIRFDFNKFSWQWEVQVIKALEITDNVVELMSEKLRQFSDSTKEILRLGACIGNTFTLNTIGAIAQQNRLALTSALWPAVEVGVLLPEGANYKMSQVHQEMEVEIQESDLNPQYQFAHDKIQQAAYSLIPEEEKETIHLGIGKLLLQERGELDETALFEIMGHINYGKNLIQSKDEKVKYASLNLKAGRKAKRSLAYDSALVYLRQGIEFCQISNPWQDEQIYPVLFDLFLEKAEVNYLLGAHIEAEETADTALQHATNDADRARVYLLKGLLNTTVGRLAEALAAIKEGLRIFGLEIPSQVDQVLIGENLMKIEELRAGRRIEDFLQLPENQSQASYLKILFLAIGATPAFFLDKTLWVWVISQMVKISIEDGNTDLSDLGYSAFGLFIGSSLGQYTESYEYGKLALKLNKKYNKIENLAKIGVIFGQLVSPWKAHVRDNIEYAREGFRAGIETGDLIYAGYCAIHLTWDLFLVSRPLAEVIIEIDKVLEFFEKSKDGVGYASRVLKRMVLRLQDENLSSTLGVNEQDELEFFQEIQEMYNKFPLSTYCVAKMRLQYYRGEHESVVQQMPMFLENMHATLGSAFNSDGFFFQALALIALIEKNGDVAEDKLSSLEKTIDQLRLWSEHAPMNYQYKYQCVMAEKMRVIDLDPAKAEQFYDQSIQSAHENGYSQDESLCAQLAGKFYLDRGRRKIARTYLTDALEGYKNWGAPALANELIKTYPNLLKSSQISEIGEKKSSSSGTGKDLDWATLLKSTAVLSGEIVLDKLLDKLMKILVENAGAQRCYVTYRDDENQQFFVEAEASVDLAESKVLHHQPLDKSMPICREIVQYVNRTGKTVVVDDARIDARFKDTPYIVEAQPKSILAMNIVLQNRPNAIIYLENNLATAAFSKDRLEFLRILAAQVSISLENALVYRDLEEKVNNRTVTIEKQKEIISQEKNRTDDLLFNILPKATAEELKLNGKAEPKYFNEVSILFTDFVGFTEITEGLSPEQLIESLSQCFLAFDEIAEKNNLEKIKTIGDSYMCAGGVPVPDPDHALNAIKAGLQIQSFIGKWNQQRRQSGKTAWPLRVGIHTGSVIAGVVGMRKFAYDIWGDAVNIASRMESSSEPDKVNISANTYNYVRDTVDVEYRGKIEAKNKGKIDMFFVKGLIN